jgi:hypothetical protein
MAAPGLLASREGRRPLAKRRLRMGCNGGAKSARCRYDQLASVRYRTAGACGNPSFRMHVPTSGIARRFAMNAIIYLVGLVVVVMFILSLVGLR